MVLGPWLRGLWFTARGPQSTLHGYSFTWEAPKAPLVSRASWKIGLNLSFVIYRLKMPLDPERAFSEKMVAERVADPTSEAFRRDLEWQRVLLSLEGSTARHDGRQ